MLVPTNNQLLHGHNFGSHSSVVVFPGACRRYHHLFLGAVGKAIGGGFALRGVLGLRDLVHPQGVGPREWRVGWASLGEGGGVVLRQLDEAVFGFDWTILRH